MNIFNLKKAMEQVHISEEMKKEIMMNIQNQMENGKKKTWNWKKFTAAAAVVVLAGVVSIPVQAVVNNFVQARMESIPEEEVQDVKDMLGELRTEADGFSREYSAEEKERSQALWQAYKNGTFPEKAIAQVEHEDEITEGTLCYDRSTGVFHLPEQEMTDEEILEIIDFQHEMSYVVAKDAPTQEEMDAEDLAERAMLEEKVRQTGGISEEKAIEIARKAMAADIGERNDRMKLHIESMHDWKSFIWDITDWKEFGGKGEIGYFIQFDDIGDASYSYHCEINALDGSILRAYGLTLAESADDSVIVYYEH